MPTFFAFSLFLNMFLQGMAVFATRSWPSPSSGLPHFPVRYLGERCASTTAKTKYLLYEINLPICRYSGDFWWRDSWTASPSPSSSSPVNQHHEGLLGSLTSLQPGYRYQIIHSWSLYLPMLLWRRKREKEPNEMPGKHLCHSPLSTCPLSKMCEVMRSVNKLLKGWRKLFRMSNDAP